MKTRLSELKDLILGTLRLRETFEIYKSPYRRRTSLVYYIISAVYSNVARKLYLFETIIGKRIFKQKILRVNIGGGAWYKRGWKVMDFRSEWYQIPKQFIDYSHDLMSKEKLPFKDNSVEMFYSEHVLEHIPDQFCKHTLSEIYRCLKKGGAVRIVVPDIDLAYQACKSRDRDFFHSISRAHYRRYTSVEECLLHYFAGYFESKDRKVKVDVDIEAVRHNFQNLQKKQFLDFYTKQIAKWLTPSIQHKYASFHVNWFDYQKVKEMLENAGFKRVYRSTSQGSKFKEMRGKEFDTRPSWSLHVEAIKT